ncbi:hypothetical protein NQ317_003332 [Molorchus minor]|uniref:Uncharacterized protein n=1 Tax=Molorchus minor TaxID=1323400 RepID=A0ABQ9IR69_9CUCU|nr:hypothetical protein NQ317_003332 [Molorchus minor]
MLQDNFKKSVTFALVRFTDSSLGIYNIKNVTQIDESNCLVKHKGGKYEAQMIDSNDDVHILKEMKNIISDQEAAVLSNNLNTNDINDNNQDAANLTINTTDLDLMVHTEPYRNSSTTTVDFSNISIGSELLQSDTVSFDENVFSSIMETHENNPVEDNIVTTEPEPASEPEEFDDSDADQDYVPLEDDVSDEDFIENSSIEKENLVPQNRSHQNSSLEGVNITTLDDLSACDDEQMHVEIPKGPSGDKKYNCCYYCKKKQLKIARHLENKHKDQVEVKKFLSLPKKSMERRRAIDVLRKKGNYIFNTSRQLNDGELIVSRRPRAGLNRTAQDFKACGKCKAFFSKHSLRAHFSICSGKSSKSHRLVMFMSKRAMRRVHSVASDTVRDRLFPSLKDDAISKNTTDLTSLYDPKYSDDTLKAINLTGKFDNQTNCYETPTVPFQIGSLLKYIGNVLINESIKRHDDVRRKNVEDFLKLLDMDVAVSLPLREDIKKLHFYLIKKMEEAVIKLNSSFSIESWTELAESTLVYIQLFNRRRAGEIERTLIEDFEKYQKIDENTDKDLFMSLSEDSRQHAKKYVRFLITSKLYRTVPVILDNCQFENVKLICKFRKDANVPATNPYLFGINGGHKNQKKFLRACVLLRKYSTECGAKHPDRLRGTKLRKHIATTCISLNLNETEVTELANFMGHHEKIHKSIYRQPVLQSDILKMSKLLEVAQGTNEKSDDEPENTDSDEEEFDAFTKNEGNDEILTPRKRSSEYTML